MPRWFLFLSIVGLLMGCAAVTPQGVSPPLPDDLTTWSTPTPVSEPPAISEPSASEGNPPGPVSKAERVYTFEAGKAYRVDVSISVPADVILEVGEQIRNVVGGDRAAVEGQEGPRWEVKEGLSGAEAQARPHVFISVTAPGLTMGVVVTTTKRTYYLTCQSVARTPIRAVRWTYPGSPPPAKPRALAMVLPDATQPQRYHVGYGVASSQPAPVWMPQQIVDDGRKVYLLLPPAMQYSDAPMVRLLGPNGPELVNSRQYRSVIIVDRIFTRAELRIGIGPQAETVTVTRQAPRLIECPGAEDCPVWPQATGILAGKE